MGVLQFSDYRRIADLFTRLLGLIYLIAFASLAVQVLGLVGSEGILPAADMLANIEATSGSERFFQLPTLFWWHAGDFTLVAATFLGCLFSLQILFAWHARAALVINFLLYLSLFNVCQPFLHFQWDGLLLEAGFLAIFLGTRSTIVIWLFRWLLFKLRFMSGVAKLSLGDPAWSGLTALNTYFEVQPLPNPLSWYAHHLPEIVLRAGTAATLFVEILVPFMMFMPRRWRFAAAWITILWQVLIMLTSNHNWINLLTILLCLFLFDDRALQRVLPGRKTGPDRLQPARPPSPVSTAVLSVLALFIGIVSAAQLWMLTTRLPAPAGIAPAVDMMETYRIANMYHVFPTMTTERVELVLSGSHDGEDWKTYRFEYKPEELDERPQLIIPHQPRLDWQMWFVPLHPKHLPWFETFVYRLLDGASDAAELLEYNPFPDEPPRYIRVDAWRYTYTTPEQRERTGNWWNRESLGPFLPFPGAERVKSSANERQ